MFKENKFVNELVEDEVRNTLALPVLDADKPYSGLISGDPIPNYNIHKRYPDKKLASKRWGSNAHIRYNKNDLVTLNSVLHDTAVNEEESTLEITEYNSFINLDMKPQKTGAMMSLTSVPFKNTSFQIYVMVQQTKINDYADSLDVNGNAIDTDGDGKTRFDYYHSATPAFTGGINMNYKSIDKLNININSYFYGHQYLVINDEKNAASTEVNIILNATANYEIYAE